MRAATPRHGRQTLRDPLEPRRVGPRFEAKRQLRRLLQGEVAGGKGVGMAEAEQAGRYPPSRARRPSPRPARRGRPRRRARQGPRGRGRLGRRLGERPQRAHLGGRQAAAAQRPRRSPRSVARASSGAIRASSRPKIALALATETCCDTMIAARPANPGSRRRSGGGPPTAIRRPTSSGSFAPQGARPPRAGPPRGRSAGRDDSPPVFARGRLVRACARRFSFSASAFCRHAAPIALPLVPVLPLRSPRRTARCTSATPIPRSATRASPPRPAARLLLRIEDFDRTRCKRAFEAAIVEDLAWLGLRSTGRCAGRASMPRIMRGARYARRAGPRLPLLLQPRRKSRAPPRARSRRRAALCGACRALSAPAKRGAPRARRTGGLRLDMARARAPRAGRSCWREFGEGFAVPRHRGGRSGGLGRRRPPRPGPRRELSSGGRRRRRAAGRHRRRARPGPLRRDLRSSPAAGAARPRRRRAIVTIASCSTPTAASCRKAEDRRRSPRCGRRA